MHSAYSQGFSHTLWMHSTYWRVQTEISFPLNTVLRIHMHSGAKLYLDRRGLLAKLEDVSLTQTPFRASEKGLQEHMSWFPPQKELYWCDPHTYIHTHKGRNIVGHFWGKDFSPMQLTLTRNTESYECLQRGSFWQAEINGETEREDSVDCQKQFRCWQYALLTSKARRCSGGQLSGGCIKVDLAPTITIT
jgi:hypothetical protein